MSLNFSDPLHIFYFMHIIRVIKVNRTYDILLKKIINIIFTL